MLVLHTGTFGSSYPADHQITLRGGYTFSDLNGRPYTANHTLCTEATLEYPRSYGSTLPSAWSTSTNGVLAPFHLGATVHTVNVVVEDR